MMKTGNSVSGSKVMDAGFKVGQYSCQRLETKSLMELPRQLVGKPFRSAGRRSPEDDNLFPLSVICEDMSRRI